MNMNRLNAKMMNQDSFMPNVSESKLLREVINSDQESIRAVLIGPVCVVISSLKVREWEWIMTSHQDVTRIVGENGKITFKVELSDCSPGSVSDEGVIWGSIPNEDGYAIATILLDPGTDDRQQLVLENLSTGLMNLNMIESSAISLFRRAEDKHRKTRTRIVMV